MTETEAKMNPRYAHDNRAPEIDRPLGGLHSVDVVVGGQYGSEAKGHATQQLIRKLGTHAKLPVLNIRVAGPNAGHTVYYGGNKLALRQLPVGVAESRRFPEGMFLGIAPGSEVLPLLLLEEIHRAKDCGAWGPDCQLIIDPEATLMVPGDAIEENALGMSTRLGSTAKGIGEARARRIMRQPGRRIGDDPEVVKMLEEEEGVVVAPLNRLYHLPQGATLRYRVVIEGTQGFGLGLHAGDYPQCTSSDCTAIDFLAMAGISPWLVPPRGLRVWVVFRPFPIRVAGHSGPLYGETTWEALGLPPEYTTVTNKKRRVGLWDASLAARAVRANGGREDKIVSQVVAVLTMADQLDPDITGATDDKLIWQNTTINPFICAIEEQTGVPVALVTTSSTTAAWLPVDLPTRASKTPDPLR